MKNPNASKMEDDPSLLKANLDSIESWATERPRPKGPLFYDLVKELGDPAIAEMLWLYYGGASLAIIDSDIPYLNSHRRWWQIWKKKNTIRSLMDTMDGKRWIWQMLHDAGAWM